MPREPHIAIVGVCASGKTTLMNGLRQLGYEAHAVPQEHSVVRRLWEKLFPQTNVLIMLDARYDTTKGRRPDISYGPERLQEQHRRLAPARERCDLFLQTDDLTIEQVRNAVVSWVEHWKEMS